MSRPASPMRMSHEDFNRDIRWRLKNYYDALHDVDGGRVNRSVYLDPAINSLRSALSWYGLGWEAVPPGVDWLSMLAHNGWIFIQGNTNSTQLKDLVNTAIQSMADGRSIGWDTNIRWAMANQIVLNNGQWRASLGPKYVWVSDQEKDDVLGIRKTLPQAALDEIAYLQQVFNKKIAVQVLSRESGYRMFNGTFSTGSARSYIYGIKNTDVDLNRLPSLRGVWPYRYPTGETLAIKTVHYKSSYYGAMIDFSSLNDTGAYVSHYPDGYFRLYRWSIDNPESYDTRSAELNAYFEKNDIDKRTNVFQIIGKLNNPVTFNRNGRQPDPVHITNNPTDEEFHLYPIGQPVIAEFLPDKLINNYSYNEFTGYDGVKLLAIQSRNRPPSSLMHGTTNDAYLTDYFNYLKGVIIAKHGGHTEMRSLDALKLVYRAVRHYIHIRRAYFGYWRGNPRRVKVYNEYFIPYTCHRSCHGSC